MSVEPILAALDSLITSISTSTSSASSVNTFDTTPFNAAAETAAEKVELRTITSEDNIMLTVDYHNKETGLTAHVEKQLYPDNSLDKSNSTQFDLSLPSDNPDISPASDSSPHNSCQESDILNDLLNDSAHDARRQEIDENNKTHAHNTTQKPQKFIREQDLHKDRIYYHSDFAGIPLDSDLILKSPDTLHDPRSALSSSIVAARMDRLITFYTRKTNINSKFKSELAFCQAIRSGKVLELFNHIYDSHLACAEAAFDELKKLWIRKRKHMFIIRNSYKERELAFMGQLGIDIMIKAERALITRPDYIAKYADATSLKTIQEYKEFCIQLQQKGNRAALEKEIERLSLRVKKEVILPLKYL